MCIKEVDCWLDNYREAAPGALGKGNRFLLNACQWIFLLLVNHQSLQSTSVCSDLIDRRLVRASEARLEMLSIFFTWVTLHDAELNCASNASSWINCVANQKFCALPDCCFYLVASPSGLADQAGHCWLSHMTSETGWNDPSGQTKLSKIMWKHTLGWSSCFFLLW